MSETKAAKLHTVPAGGYWTAKEVAEFLKMSVSWVYMQAEAKKIPHRKFGAALRFSEQEIRDWAEGKLGDGQCVVVVTPLRR
jgi:excisionase family DNA binding protein